MAHLYSNDDRAHQKPLGVGQGTEAPGWVPVGVQYFFLGTLDSRWQSSPRARAFKPERLRTAGHENIILLFPGGLGSADSYLNFQMLWFSVL